MKNIVLIDLVALLCGCGQNEKVDSIVDMEPRLVDVSAELAAIEETRSAFQLAIKEKRYSDLGKYATDDMKGVSPGSVEWLAYRKQREEPMGKFSYDSIIMSPKETVIASDSIAYNFGKSKVYYTNNLDEPIELQDTF